MHQPDPSAYDKKPPEDTLKQQRLRSWTPGLTPFTILVAYLIIIAFCIALGISILVASSKVKQIIIRYDQLPCNLNVTANQSISQYQNISLIPPPLYSEYEDRHADGASCYLQLLIPIKHDMNGPLYFYYHLRNFYQNHKQYARSVSAAQLQGQDKDINRCTSLQTLDGKRIVPCGLIANSFFNDSFALQYCANSSTIISLSSFNSSACRFLSNSEWQKNGIAIPTDKSRKFRNVYPSIPYTIRSPLGGFDLPNLSDEDLMVWMDISTIPTFHKLYRIMNMNLKAGDTLLLHVNDVFPVQQFSGEKRIVISNTSWMGGKNTFLGYAYIFMASFALACALIYLMKRIICPRKLGDLSYFAHSLADKQSLSINAIHPIIDTHHSANVVQVRSVT